MKAGFATTENERNGATKRERNGVSGAGRGAPATKTNGMERATERERNGVSGAGRGAPATKTMSSEQSSDRSRRRRADRWERRLPRSARSVSSPDGRLMTADCSPDSFGREEAEL